MSAKGDRMAAEFIYRQLLNEGGYCETSLTEGGGGTVTVRFNKGCHPSRALRQLMKSNASLLKSYVLARRREWEAEERRLAAHRAEMEKWDRGLLARRELRGTFVDSVAE